MDLNLARAIPILRMHDPGGGRALQLIDPASNRIRFFERPMGSATAETG